MEKQNRPKDQGQGSQQSGQKRPSTPPPGQKQSPEKERRDYDKE